MSIESRGSIEIAAPPDEVFEWLVDNEKQSKWLEGRIDWTPGDRDRLHEGYKGKEKLALAGKNGAKPAETEVEVLEIDEPERLEVEITGRVAKVRTRFELEANGGGTRVENETVTDYRGVIGQVGKLAVAAKDIDVEAIQENGIETGLARLKELVEGG